MIKKIIAFSSILILAFTFSGCAKRIVESSSGIILVESDDAKCKLSSDSTSAGNVVFRVSNTGSNLTEFYILENDGKTIVSEVENIGSALTRDLVVRLYEGDYFVKCIPNMDGDGIRSKFKVTAGETNSGSIEDETFLNGAANEYKKFVIEQTTLLLEQTQNFTKLYLAGDLNGARKLYPEARMYWERIEPVAESFGDLDPLLDLREIDLEVGQEWTGWHLFEKDLWPPKSGYQPLSKTQREKYSTLLNVHTQDLAHRVLELDYKPFQMGNGAKELLDEVATGKITGEEEIWSGTDLWDFQANVEGALKVFELLRPIVQKRDPELSDELDRRFADVLKLLEDQRSKSGFTNYSKLSKAEIIEMATAVDSLGAPLSKLTAVVVA